MISRTWWLARLTLPVVLAGLVAGCSASSSAPKCGAACLSSIDREVTTVPAGELTGLGADSVDWDIMHARDADPDLDAGCCYIPRIPFAGQSTLTDTWVAVQTDENGRVYIFQHNFTPGTTVAEAQADVERLDLPPDAKLVETEIANGCRQFLYRSARLAAAMDGAYASVYFVSPPDETVYKPRNIWFAGVSISEDRIEPC